MTQRLHFRPAVKSVWVRRLTNPDPVHCEALALRHASTMWTKTLQNSEDQLH